MKTLIAILFALTASAAQAQDHTTMDHKAHDQAPAAATLKEPGQAAFGAISEVVLALQKDPSTNWSKVNLERLRQHLIDMDRVTLQSQVRTTKLADGAQFEVTADAPAVTDAISRMLAAHAKTMDQAGRRSTVTSTKGGVVWIVRGDSPSDAAQIQGLGFIGLMTEGAHHQSHHLAMARGDDPHASTH